MVSRTLPTSLILSLALIGTACGDDGGADPTTTFTMGGSGTDVGDGDGDDETGNTGGDGDGDGDGDPTGDGDGDGDGDPTGDGDGDGDGDECLDLDQDGYGENCDMGPDCDDEDYYNHTVDGCANCDDSDMDGHWLGCDTFDESQPGPDCDDMDFNVFDNCDTCVDEDNDGVWVGCDQYGDLKPGPDCDDDNANVGLDDAVEICNGLSENCAGEVDNAPPDEMCPPNGVNAPNVAPQNGWCCNPPAPGQDGCEICGCVEQFFDLDDVVEGGCECEATPRTDSLAACSDAPQGYLGMVGEAEALNNLVIGQVPLIDNGVGNGAEDWFSVDFLENDAQGTRPNTGSIQVSFAVNDGTDYRFEIYRACNGVAFAGSLATSFGVGAPPTRQWWFFDNHNFGSPTNNVAWPDTVYIRVFRVQNDKTCNDYQLAIERVDN